MMMALIQFAHRSSARQLLASVAATDLLITTLRGKIDGSVVEYGTLCGALLPQSQPPALSTAAHPLIHLRTSRPSFSHHHQCPTLHFKPFHTSPSYNQKESEVPATSTSGWSTKEVVNLPNSISVARLLSGPFIANWIIDGQWSLALSALAVSGMSDWLDGYVARKQGTVNVLGSYLDPLADKVLVVSVVGALGYTGALPAPLVGIIIGRDALLIGGALAARAQSLGWKWPGLSEFFRIIPAAGNKTETESASLNSNSSTSIRTSINNTDSSIPSRQDDFKKKAGAVSAAPLVQPLYISKVNTALQLTLVGACISDAWLGWPGESAVWGIGYATAGTTVWSLAAYAVAFKQGRFLTAGGGKAGQGT